MFTWWKSSSGKGSHRRAGAVLGLAVPLVLGGVPAGAGTDRAEVDLTELDLADLVHVEVRTVSRKTVEVLDSPAAIHILTREDILSSGVTTLAGALRMVPGLDVARIDSSTWAVSARGFTSQFANKMLVLVDGRSVYSPLFAGVYWDVQDTLLEDVDRIEVIRGPGATMWGANAVNGVINVVTRSAAETEGGHLTTLAGNEERGMAALRLGTAVRDDLFVRAYAKYVDRDERSRPTGGEAHDAWSVSRAGFRSDWLPGSRDTVTVQGDLYDGDAGQTTVIPILEPPWQSVLDEDVDIRGAYVSAQWVRETGAEAESALRVYWNRTVRREEVLSEERTTFDLDYQRRRRAGRHDLIWGTQYRTTRDDIDNSFDTSLTPDATRHDLWAAFVQDEIRLVDDRLRVTLGSKLEHNEFTGWEHQPSARLLWKLDGRRSTWAAVSRAVRSPARGFTDVRINQEAFPDPGGGMPHLVVIRGNPAVRSEVLRAHEAGYRACSRRQVCTDVAVFYNVYDDLVTGEPAAPFVETDPPPVHIVHPVLIDNRASGRSYGLEISSVWQPAPRLRLTGWYALVNLDVDPDPGSASEGASAGDSPEHHVHLRGRVLLPHDLTLEAGWWWRDERVNQGVPPRDRTHLRFGWQPTPGIELSIVAENLVDDGYREFGDNLHQPLATRVDRSVHGRLRWRF